MRSRRALLSLLLATLLPTSCGGPRLRVGDFVLEATAPGASGEEYLYYRASVFNDGPGDVEGGWAQIVGPVAGATVVDGVLVFGPAPAGAASADARFIVRHPAGAPFDPASLQWAIVAGVFDFDADGLSDGEEADRGLAGDLGDTDGDGVEDGAEVLFRLALTWGPSESPDWGTHIDYFEIGADGWAVRQINAHSSGPSLKYDVTHPADSFGFLADAPFPPSPYPLEPGDGEAREISAEEFEGLWAGTRAINRE